MPNITVALPDGAELRIEQEVIDVSYAGMRTAFLNGEPISGQRAGELLAEVIARQPQGAE